MSKRDYSEAPDSVRNCYQKMRQMQTADQVLRLYSKYSVPSGAIMTVWAAINTLDSFIDLSDPDMDLPNIIHMFQTAEGLRKAGEPDWMQLTGLIHDLGKCIFLRGCDSDGTSLKEQWSIVGDTFVIGDPFPESLPYPEFNSLNEDSECQLYPPGCGLSCVYISYGHDEYLYQILQRSGHRLPPAALYMIRYHSLYAWHQYGAYLHLENDTDREMKPWVQRFNQYDLYTKEHRTYTEREMSELRDYYSGLIAKYLPNPLIL